MRVPAGDEQTHLPDGRLGQAAQQTHHAAQGRQTQRQQGGAQRLRRRLPHRRCHLQGALPMSHVMRPRVMVACQQVPSILVHTAGGRNAEGCEPTQGKTPTIFTSTALLNERCFRATTLSSVTLLKVVFRPCSLHARHFTHSDKMGKHLIGHKIAETVQRQHAHQADDAVLEPDRVGLRGRRCLSGRHPGQPPLAVPV